jgi:hypothetical protein
MEAGLYILFAIGVIVFGTLICAILFWRWRVERENDLSQLAINPTPGKFIVDVKPLSDTNPKSVVTQILGNISPDLTSLAALARISSSIQMKTVDGKPISKEEQINAMRIALSQVEEQIPDSPLIQHLRNAIERASTVSSIQDSTDVKVIRVENQIRFQYNGEEFSAVESIPNEEAREKARTILGLIR